MIEDGACTTCKVLLSENLLYAVSKRVKLGVVSLDLSSIYLTFSLTIGSAQILSILPSVEYTGDLKT